MVLFYSLIVLNLIIFSDNIELQFESFYQSDQTFKKYDKQRKNTTLERSISFSLRRPRNPKFKWGFDYNDISPFLSLSENEQYRWNWIGLQLKPKMTSMFLKSHFFRCQKKDGHKWSVSSAIKWINKNQNSDSTNKTIRYRRQLHVMTRMVPARKLKLLLKKYMRKENTEQEIFGNIINLSNRMY